MEKSANYIEKLEAQFIDLAQEAVKSASRQALKSGRTIVVRSNDNPEII